MSLLLSLRSEILKSKRTPSVYLTLLAAAVVPFIFVLDSTVDGISPENQSTIFSQMFIEGFRMSGFVILPLFIILVCTLLPQVEYKNNTWKQVLTSPQTKANVFVAKFINIHFLILLFILANQFFLLMAAVLLHVVEPSFNVLNQPIDGYEILVNIVNAYVSLLAIGTLQFWLGLRFRNFIIPIGIGISLWVIGSMLVMEYKFDWAVYFPYSFHVYNSFPNYKPLLNKVEWASGAYTAAFLLLGFLDFKIRKIKS